MRIYEVKERNLMLLEKLLNIWESPVQATHLFLSNSEIANIKRYIPQALENVSHLIVSETENQIPIAFMGIEENKLEMLFVLSEERGKGVGKSLLKYGIENYGVNELAVNEQNPRAKGFYEHMGFQVYKRTDIDEQGNRYPLLYMKLN